MAEEQPGSPSFGDLLKQGQSFLDSLEALESRVALELADHHAEVGRLRDQMGAAEKELGNFREAQRQWPVERERLAGAVSRLEQEVELAQGQLRDERRSLKEERDGLLASHEEQQRDLRERLDARESTLEEARVELRQLQEQIDELHGAQLQAAADRQRLTDELDAHRSAHETLQLEHRTVLNELSLTKAELQTLQGYQLQWAVEREELLNAARTLTDERAALEAKVAGIQQQGQATGSELEAGRRKLETQLEEARQRIAGFEQAELTRKDEYDKLSRAHAELIAQASKLNSESSARRQSLVAEIQQLNKELNQAMGSLAHSQDRDRQREKSMQELKESWQREKTELEIALRNGRAESGGGPVTAEHLHALNSHLNVITGFSNLLVQEGVNVITGEERLQYLRHINESGRRFADELHALWPSKNEPGVSPGSLPIVPPTPPARAKPVILVADADPATVQRIEPFLSRAGYEVVVAPNAAEAVERTLRLHPIAVVIDAALPPRGAAGLVEDLKRERRTRDLPIVLTSSDDSAPVGEDVADFDFLPKPIDRQQLLQVLVKFDLQADSVRAQKMPGTVLVVDDNQHHISLVKATLKPFNINVLTAEGGREGIEAALKHHPELVILDLMMPQVDGYQVIEALRKAPEMSEVPIVIYTAKSIAKEDEHRLKGAIQAIIQKGDYNKERLLEVVQKRGERRGQRSGQRPPAPDDGQPR